MKRERKQNRSRLLEGLEERRLMAVFTVTNGNDDGAGSLRQAIASANAAVGSDTIAFNVPGNPTNVLITPSTPLPEITSPVTIDGTTQAGFAASVDPIIRVRGFNLTNANGLVVKSGANGSIIRGLLLSGFKRSVQTDEAFGNAVVFDTGVLGGKVEQCVIGGVAGNQGSGVVLRGQNALVENNRIYLNRTGVRIEGVGATTNAIVSNAFELNGNFEAGVVIANGASNNTIGGSTTGAGNVFASNDKEAIRIDTSDPALVPTANKIQGNTFGLNGSGGVSGDGNGIRILAANNTLIGGTGTHEGNVFTHTIGSHVELSGSASTNTTVHGNYFGMKRDGTVLPSAVTDYAIRVKDGATATIGGSTAAARNFITGGDANAVGILVENTSATIRNNVIGMNAAGSAVGVLDVGVRASDAANLILGGSGATDGNYIANAKYQIYATGGSSLTIHGNRLGFTPTGTLAGGITGTGIYANTGNLIIGGANAGERNYITGNGANARGIDLVDLSTATVHNNCIGFAPSGTPMGSMQKGIFVESSSEVNIGGLGAGQGNVLTNATTLIKVVGINQPLIAGNQLGLNLAGTSLAGTTGTGIDIDNCTAANIVNNIASIPSGAGQRRARVGENFVAIVRHLRVRKGIGSRAKRGL